MKIVCLLSLLLGTCFTSYPYRDIKKPIIALDDDIQIIQLSTGRTGSTLIYNILNYLFEDVNYHIGTDIQDFSIENIRVRKRHYFVENTSINRPRILLFESIREPLDILASHYNKDRTFYNKEKSFYAKEFHPMTTMCNIENIESHDIEHLIFKYEEFENDNFDYIYKKIEDFMGITIPDIEKRKIKSFFCIKSMRDISNNLVDFRGIDKYTSMHGKHINGSKFWEVFSLRYAITLYKNTYETRKQWGYPDLDLKEIYNISKK